VGCGKAPVALLLLSLSLSPHWLRPLSGDHTPEISVTARLADPRRETGPHSTRTWVGRSPVPAPSGSPEMCAWLAGVQSCALSCVGGEIERSHGYSGTSGSPKFYADWTLLKYQYSDQVSENYGHPSMHVLQISPCSLAYLLGHQHSDNCIFFLIIT
jgi:hypothetical protein